MELGFFWAVVLVILMILTTSLIYALRRALNKIELYEVNEQTYRAFNNQLENQLRNSIEEMRKIDIRGSFESDDEVGAVFGQLKAMVDALEVFRLEQSSEIDAEG
jgi:type II secretory pathway pseudopilin PulG